MFEALPSSSPCLERCDPGAMLRAWLAKRCAEPAPRDLLLCWILRLSRGIDPADAARVLVSRLPEWRDRNPGSRELRQLLHETACWPRRRVAALPVRRRRSPSPRPRC